MDLRIAVAQIESLNGNIKANLEKIKNVVSSVTADLYIFPELFLTGYSVNDLIYRFALAIDSNPIKELLQIASKNRIGIIVGFPEYSDMGYIYNSALAIDDKGNIYIYRKRHIPTFGPFDESRWFKSYRGYFSPWIFKGYKIGITICYDIFYPEIFRTYMLNNVKIFINISAAPDTSIQLFHTVSRARALENSSYFIWVNSVGFNGGFGLGGASVIVDPLGNILYTLKYYEEETYDMNININEINTFRFERPLLKDIIFEDFYILFRSMLKTLKIR
jgi:predicted amidohydrolase